MLSGPFIVQIVQQVTPAPSPVSPLEPLRVALAGKFALVTDQDKAARLWPMRSAVADAFKSWQSFLPDNIPALQGIIYSMLDQTDVSDDDQLSDIKAQMLALPEWNQ